MKLSAQHGIMAFNDSSMLTWGLEHQVHSMTLCEVSSHLSMQASFFVGDHSAWRSMMSDPRLRDGVTQIFLRLGGCDPCCCESGRHVNDVQDDNLLVLQSRVAEWVIE
eukprot:6465764-Amphidinium_carterae.1